MKVVIQRNLLLEALQQTQSVVERKSTVPILSNVLIDASGDRLTVRATDMEVGVSVQMTAQILQEGRLTVSAKALFEIVKELPPQWIEISAQTNDWIEILCGKSKFKVVGLSAQEFPSLPSFENKHYVEASVQMFKRMIDATAFSVSTDATRYLMNGVFFEAVNETTFRMVSTDGHRLALFEEPCFIGPFELKKGVIIPKKGLAEFRKLLDFQADSFQMAIERGLLFLKFGDSSLYIRLIEGEYPDYRQVIPKAVANTLIVDHDQFNSALKRVSLLAHEKSRGVKFQIESKVLTIYSNNPDLGEAKEELDVVYEGPSFQVGFNSKYLLDFLGTCSAENLEIAVKDALSPGLIRPKGQTNQTYVIMPMRI